MAQQTAPRTVLVVEDDPVLSDVMRILLEDGTCRILIAQCGSEAIELAQQEHPDLITLDLRLPDGDGRYVLDQIRQDPVLQGVPVIIVSGSEFHKDSSPEVIAVLPKPFDAMELDRAVHLALGLGSCPQIEASGIDR